MARAMSASLASARMKSLAPCGSAWIRWSLRSRDFSSIASPVSRLINPPLRFSRPPATSLRGTKSREVQAHGKESLGQHSPTWKQEVRAPGGRVHAGQNQFGLDGEIAE